MENRRAVQILREIKKSVEQVIIGKGEVIDQVLIALLCGGHVLIEDVPGLGKTTLVSALAQSTSCSFQRIQFTPDITPSDITGFTMFNLATGEKEFHQGAVMSQIILADEINRTSPKTQSALLQAMQEGRVTVDGNTYELPKPFMVLATQNPVELTGTYPLPEAQLDRFLMRISMGYPSRTHEVAILRSHRDVGERREVPTACTVEELTALQAALEEIKVTDTLLGYIVRLTEKTRDYAEVSLGVSPRGSIALMRAARACAMLEERDYVVPEDVQKMMSPVLAHRIVMRSQASLQSQTPEKVLEDILKQTPVPAVK